MARNVSGKAFSWKSLVPFDPEDSARFGLGILEDSGARFALAGRIAVWVYVPPNRQVNTKDVDFAVPHADMPAVLKAARKSGLPFRTLEIGGIAFRQKGVFLDFIDRHP